jgi:hypothetical protein
MLPKKTKQNLKTNNSKNKLSLNLASSEAAWFYPPPSQTNTLKAESTLSIPLQYLHFTQPIAIIYLPSRLLTLWLCFKRLYFSYLPCSLSNNTPLS